MKYAVVLFICLVVLSGCGGGPTGTSLVVSPAISGMVQNSGTYGQFQIIVYKQDHEGDSNYIISRGATSSWNGGSFKVQVPSPGTYDVDLWGVDGGGVPPPPSSGDGSGIIIVPVVLKSWPNLFVPASGIDLGTINGHP